MEEQPAGTPATPTSLARRTINSLTWNSIANLLTLPVSFLQSVLLARLLPVADFGVYGGMAALTTLCYAFFEFGLGAAALHRAPETEHEEQTMAILFTLRLILLSIGAALLVCIALVFFTDQRRQMLVVLAVSGWALRLAMAGHVLLIRRVQHRRLALMDILQTGVVFVVAVWIAASSGSIWALAVAPVVQTVIYTILLYVWMPVWRPRLAWDSSAVRYFLTFGGRVVTGTTLGAALDHVDDLWTNFYLGDLAMGYYSRAYRFAVYPRVLLAEPVNTVSLGMYAELKHDRQRRSRAFFQVNALLVRTGFLLAGWLALIAPQFIRIFLGERWLPMLAAFQLMLVYTLFDPLKMTIANLFFAVGQPEVVSKARLVQLVALAAGLFLLGSRFGIAGVALSVDFMLVIGIGLLLVRARSHVDISLLRLFAAPAVALVLGFFTTAAIGRVMLPGAGDWLSLVVKSLVYVLLYGSLLFLLERRQLLDATREVLATGKFVERV